MQAIAKELKTKGASLIVVSPQLEKFSTQMSEKNSLTFSVLSDTENKVASSYGLVFKLLEDLAGLYRKFGIDLNEFNGNNTWELPMPGRFIIDQKGFIIDVDVNPDYTKRPEPENILTIVNKF